MSRFCTSTMGLTGRRGFPATKYTAAQTQTRVDGIDMMVAHAVPLPPCRLPLETPVVDRSVRLSSGFVLSYVSGSRQPSTPTREDGNFLSATFRSGDVAAMTMATEVSPRGVTPPQPWLHC